MFTSISLVAELGTRSSRGTASGLRFRKTIAAATGSRHRPKGVFARDRPRGPLLRPDRAAEVEQRLGLPAHECGRLGDVRERVRAYESWGRSAREDLAFDGARGSVVDDAQPGDRAALELGVSDEQL